MVNITKGVASEGGAGHAFQAVGREPIIADAFGCLVHATASAMSGAGYIFAWVATYHAANIGLQFKDFGISPIKWL